MTSRTGKRNRYIVRAGCLVGAVALVTAAAGAVASPATAAGRAGATWTLSKPQIPQIHNGSLTAESCPGTSACFAVGFAAGPSGPSRILAEAWNGTTWRVLPTPALAGSKGANLDAVSCRTATACTAVGTFTDSSGTEVPLAEAWNGTAWSIQTTPIPSGSHGAVLDGVSCTGATACIAVGYYENVDSQENPVAFAEAWNGTAWTIQPVPNSGAGDSSLFAVSCTSPHACIAVGSISGSSGLDQVLAEVWNGTAWAIRPPVVPVSSRSSALNGVSCTAANACTAVGHDIQAGTFATLTLAEVWNGSAWAIQHTPTPGGSASLAAVSCTAANACTAVGSQNLSSPGTLAEAWNGITWTTQPTPAPTGAGFSPLTGVSCAAAGRCGAAGYSFPQSGTRHALAEGRTGTMWTLQAPVNPRGAESSSLGSVSCTSADSCVAVGTSTAQSWNGTRWRDLSAARPSGATSINLTGVSCAAATACMAVGFFTNSASGGPLTESWNGTAWTLHPPAKPSGATGISLTGVSCTTATACMAVGWYFTSSGKLALAESWNGTAWTIRPIAEPADSDASELNGVSCTGASSCIAVGDHHLAGRSDTLELAEAWNGTAWSIQPTPGTSGTRILNSVSCTGSNACATVGFRGGGPLAETWNGTAWTAETPPSPKNGFDVFLNGVSCVAASNCTATGNYSLLNTGFGMTLAEVWNGTAWQLRHTVSPSNTEIVGFDGISCMATGVCTAVGSYGPSEPSLGAFVPFAEQRS